MTVAEFIEKLSRFKQDLIVLGVGYDAWEDEFYIGGGEFEIVPGNCCLVVRFTGERIGEVFTPDHDGVGNRQESVLKEYKKEQLNK